MKHTYNFEHKGVWHDGENTGQGAVSPALGSGLLQWLAVWFLLHHFLLCNDEGDDPWSTHLKGLLEGPTKILHILG